MNINDSLDAIKKAISFKKNLKYYIPIVNILFIAICAVVIFELAANFFSDYSSNNNFSESYTLDDDGAIIISDEELDKFIEEFEALGLGGFEALGLTNILNLNTEEEIQEAKRAYLRNFFEAQAVTETINYGLTQDPEKTYGTVYVYRTNDGAKTTNITENPDNVYRMTYLPYEQWTAKKEACEASTDTSTYDITDYFSLNNEGKLVYAGWNSTVVSEDGVVISNEARINEISVNYKNVLTNYKTTVNYFLYLVLATQNPEFAIDFANEVKDSQIHITIMDSYVDSVEEVTNSYTNNKLFISRVLAPPTSTEIETTTPSLSPTVNYNYIANTEQTSYSTTTTTTMKSQTPTIDITYAKVWFATQELDYNQTPTVIENTEVTDPENEDAISFSTSELEAAYYLQFSSDYTWKTNMITTTKINSTITKFSEGTKYAVDYEVGFEKFKELLDTEHEIISTGRKNSAGNMLKVTSNANLLLYYLGKDSELQRLEEITRYFMEVYISGDEFDSSRLTGELLGFGALNTVSGNSGMALLRKYINSYENNPSASTLYYDDTELTYKIYNDGRLSVGYGYVIDYEDRQASIKEYYAAIGETVVFEEGYPIYIECIEKLIDDHIDTLYTNVKNYIQRRGIQLEEYQIYALTARAYARGTAGAGLNDSYKDQYKNFGDNYNSYWNSSLQIETDEILEKQAKTYNLGDTTVSNNDLYMNYFRYTDNSINSTHEKRRESEWIAFSTGYFIFGSGVSEHGSWYSENGAILENAAIVKSYIANNGYGYQTGTRYNSFSLMQQDNSTSLKFTDCSHFVSIVLQECGLLDEGSHWSTALFATYFPNNPDLYEEVSIADIQPGDIMLGRNEAKGTGHIEIYAGDGYSYNCRRK